MVEEPKEWLRKDGTRILTSKSEEIWGKPRGTVPSRSDSEWGPGIAPDPTRDRTSAFSLLKLSPPPRRTAPKGDNLSRNLHGGGGGGGGLTQPIVFHQKENRCFSCVLGERTWNRVNIGKVILFRQRRSILLTWCLWWTELVSKLLASTQSMHA